MDIKEFWGEVPLMVKGVVTGVALVVTAIAFIQPRAMAEKQHEAIKKEVKQTKIDLQEMYKNDRIDRHKREIFKWEDEMDNLDPEAPHYDKEYKKYERRIDELNATIACIREETC